MNERKKLKQTVIFFVLIGLIVQSIMLFRYYTFDKQSSSMLLHREMIVSNLNNIKYYMAQGHLVINKIKNGANLSNEEVFKYWEQIDISLNTIIEYENKKAYFKSKKRDSTEIKRSILKLQSQFFEIKEITTKYLNDNEAKKLCLEKSYCEDKYLKFQDDLHSFELYLSDTFKKVFLEFESCKKYLYIVMLLIVIVVTILIYYFFKKALYRITHIEGQNRLIEQQSKMAAMGEILDMVAHQWKQPLNSISLNLLKIEIKKDYSKDTIDKCTKRINHKLKHLVQTLDEFRNFFRNINELKDIKLDMILQSSKLLLNDDLIHNNISLKVNYNSNIVVKVIANEFKHIFINLISNSKEAFVEKEIKNREIEITYFVENEKTIIIYEDNAGGIPESIIDKIFNLNYTTKETGTGIGLYMCKKIIEKHNASIEVKNNDEGVEFKITL